MSTSIVTEPHHRYTAAEALQPDSPLPKPLESVGRKLKKLAGRQRHSYLKDHYEIGEIARNALDKHCGPSYGTRIVDQLAEAAQINPRTLHHCLDLVEKYSREQYEALIAQPLITWTHVVHLLGVGDAKARERFAQQAIDEKQSPPELAQAITGELGHRREGSGRRPAAPKNVSNALDKLRSGTKKYQNLLHQSLFCDTFDLAQELENLPPDQVTIATRSTVDEGAQLLRELAEQAASRAESLEAMLPRIDAVLEAQKQHRDEE